jgi:hypothetical protein
MYHDIGEFNRRLKAINESMDILSEYFELGEDSAVDTDFKELFSCVFTDLVNVKQSIDDLIAKASTKTATCFEELNPAIDMYRTQLGEKTHRLGRLSDYLVGFVTQSPEGHEEIVEEMGSLMEDLVGFHSGLDGALFELDAMRPLLEEAKDLTPEERFYQYRLYDRLLDEAIIVNTKLAGLKKEAGFGEGDGGAESETDEKSEKKLRHLEKRIIEREEWGFGTYSNRVCEELGIFGKELKRINDIIEKNGSFLTLLKSF